jgi:predicted O-methyltransferase YrrM
MQKLTLVKKYLQYTCCSKTNFDIHSPFLFELVTKVFQGGSADTEYLKVEALKAQFLKDSRTISVTDLGAGKTSVKQEIRHIRDIAKTSSKSNKYGRLLFRLIKYLRPGTVLELGTSLGFSTAYMANGCPSSVIFSIEGCPNIAELAKSNFIKLDISNIHLVVGSFDDKLPGILNSLHQIDFVFIDGNHRQEPTINYFEQCLIKAVNDTVFVIDDIHWSEGMENAWDHICNHPSVTLSVDIFFMGIVFLKKELSKQHFIIRY